MKLPSSHFSLAKLHPNGVVASIKSKSKLKGFINFAEDGWNAFDIFTVAAAFIPGLNALRTLRILRIIAKVPTFKNTVSDILHAVKHSLPVFALLMLIIYVSTITAHLAMKTDLPQMFGSIEQAFITLLALTFMDSLGKTISSIAEVGAVHAAFALIYFFTTGVVVISLLIGVVLDVIDERKNHLAARRKD